MSKPHVLYLFETAVGLGHQRRASGIANGLIRNGYDVSVASGSFVNPAEYFDTKAKLLILPENRRKKNGATCHYDDENNLVYDDHFNWKEWAEERRKAAVQIAQQKPIDAVMIEWWPFDKSRRKAFDGVVNAIIEIQQRKFSLRPLIISSVRDVILTDTNFDNPEKWNETAKELIPFLNQNVDGITVHGDPALVNFQEILPGAENLRTPVMYTGYVVNESAKIKMATRNKTVFVSCGSGDDGHFLLKPVLRAMPHSRLRSYEWHFVLGPRMEIAHQQEVRGIAAKILRQTPDLKIVIHDELPGLPEALCTAGFSISLAGYNTTMEVLASKVPALFVPKFDMPHGTVRKVRNEQWDRLQRLRDLKMACITRPETIFDSEEFADIIDAAYRKGSPPIQLNMDGSNNTPVILGQLLSDKANTLRPAATPKVA